MLSCIFFSINISINGTSYFTESWKSPLKAKGTDDLENKLDERYFDFMYIIQGVCISRSR